MAARIKFGQRRLYRAVSAVDDDDARRDHRHRADRFADLVDVLDFVMEDVGMRRAIFANLRQQGTVARRTWIRKERDAGHIRYIYFIVIEIFLGASPTEKAVFL